MKRLVPMLALLWCLPNLVVAFWMVQGAFVAKTAMHEGILAQVSLLLGGILIALFALLLARVCFRIVIAPGRAPGT